MTQGSDQKSTPLLKSGKPDPSPQIAPYRFKPGQSGNPKGRRPGTATFEAVMTKLLDEAVKVTLDDGTKTERTRREQIAHIILDEIIVHRNPAVLRELMARIWPTPQGDAARSLAASAQSWVDIVRERTEELDEGKTIDVEVGGA